MVVEQKMCIQVRSLYQHRQECTPRNLCGPEIGHRTWIPYARIAAAIAAAAAAAMGLAFEAQGQPAADAGCHATCHEACSLGWLGVWLVSHYASMQQRHFTGQEWCLRHVYSALTSGRHGTAPVTAPDVHCCRIQCCLDSTNQGRLIGFVLYSISKSCIMLHLRSSAGYTAYIRRQE